MTLDEKIAQLQSQMIPFPSYPKSRNFSVGHFRNIAHFMHKKGPVSPGTCAAAINEDTRRSIAASRFGIPVLQHGEALHGASWGMATVFPQCIGIAAGFDDSLLFRVGVAVARELRAVGVRQVYAPVINIARDPRWGRMEETYGEDVFLTSRMGVAYTKALQQGGVTATLKHFVDNYGAGGHDSYASENSWRTLRETYLEPFRVCIVDGGAGGVMAAYNSVDGVPCSNNPVLLNDILRKEWGFKGIVVSDYGGVGGVFSTHHVVDSSQEAEAECLKAGLDVMLASGYYQLPGLLKSGKISSGDINRSVRRVLTAKFQLGLFENPYVDTGAANQTVRSPEHRALALASARKTMTLLKNTGRTLPLDENAVKRIGVFGPVATVLSLGDYSGPSGGWKGDSAVTPYEGLLHRLNGKAEVVLYQPGMDAAALARTCDALLYFATIQEGEASDRSQLTLPSVDNNSAQSTDHAQIVDNKTGPSIREDQEKMIRTLGATGVKTIVVLQNGSPIDIRNWIDSVAAVLEAWYPGEQGGTAIAEALFGDINPGGRLPVTWPKHVGQVPLYYSVKPSGRGYDYSDDDGKPEFPFGFGLSYTSFAYSDLKVPTKVNKGDSVQITVRVTNTGDRSGDEVIQLYLHGAVAPVVRPIKELKAFKRIVLAAGESREVTLMLPYSSFGYWDRSLRFVVMPGIFTVYIARDAEHNILQAQLQVE
ncbi:MAG TPA: glycoside hydrolase family 3 N-terminal domain-containing protein [Puia sp.]|nr:glycoside hydrolase family 3 N-terminal domain-containing protein [Puia sp.]